MKTLIISALAIVSLLSASIPAEAKVCGVYRVAHTSPITGKTTMRSVYRCSH